MNQQRWRWSEGAGLPLLRVLLRLCWIVPGVQLVHTWLAPTYAQPLLSPVVLISLYLGAAILTRVITLDLVAQKWISARTGQTILAVGGVAILLWLLWRQYASLELAWWNPVWLVWIGRRMTAWDIRLWDTGIPYPLLTLLLGTLIWRQGVLDGSRMPDHADIWRAFVLGFLALVFLLLVERINPDAISGTLDLWVWLFFASGITALALSGLELSRIGRRVQGVRSNTSPNRYWLTSVLIVMVVVLGIALIGIALISPDTLLRIFGWIGRVLDVILTVVGYVVLAIIYVMFLILTPLFNYLSGLFATAGVELDLESQGNPLRRLDEVIAQGELVVPPSVIEMGRWAGLVGLLIVLALAFAGAWRYLRIATGQEDGEVRETVFSRSLLEDQLATLWRQLGARFGRDQGAGGPFLSLDGLEQNRRAIRQLYQNLLARMSTLGMARANGQTPDEYGVVLASTLPQADSALGQLTECYRAARYGLEPPSSAETLDAQSAWTELQGPLEQAQAIADEDEPSSEAP